MFDKFWKHAEKQRPAIVTDRLVPILQDVCRSDVFDADPDIWDAQEQAEMLEENNFP